MRARGGRQPAFIFAMVAICAAAVSFVPPSSLAQEEYVQSAYYSQGEYAYSQGSYGPAEAVTFSYEYNTSDRRCVQVTVRKSSVHPRTIIRANGFNVSCDRIDTDPRVLQRSVEIRY